MDKELLKRIITNLNLKDFNKFSLNLLKNSYGEYINPYNKLDNCAFIRDLSVTDYDPFYDSGFKAIYLIDNQPYDLFSGNHEIFIDSPLLIEQLKIVKNDFQDKYFMPGALGLMENQLRAFYFLNNSRGLDKDYYVSKLIPKYENLIKKFGLDLHDDLGIGTGNPDSFIEFSSEESLKIISNLLTSNESLSIELTENSKNIKLTNSEKYLQAGVGKKTNTPFYPLFTQNNLSDNQALLEFQDLLRSNPIESKLEKFISRYYQEIFGSKYDRIETQVWLKFPELDINKKNRRLDIFLHNSIISDWELYELKRIVPLTKTYRDIHTLTSEIYSSMQQVLNYERILKQDKVKEALKKDGIEYFEPSLNLVVGRTPDISVEEWRWLVASNKSVKLLTYTELIEEMKVRQNERNQLYNNILNKNYT